MLNEITPQFFLKQLNQRVSQFDARLILDSAIVTSGLNLQMETKLDQEQAKGLCLELIKKGGPAFQVGTSIYRQLPQ